MTRGGVRKRKRNYEKKERKMESGNDKFGYARKRELNERMKGEGTSWISGEMIIGVRIDRRWSPELCIS